ncbi:MAG: hypothetical protein FJ348_04065 [Sphingomonadales bacterium]|nr:hypothetical protein [Sphingomonadales bacterium]
MSHKTQFLLLILYWGLATCSKNVTPVKAYRIVKSVNYNGVSVDVVIDKPLNDTVDVLVVYHGTVAFDSKILEAAQNTLDGFKRILTRSDMMIVSVAYPEENLLMGDNIVQAEAALLWVKNKANQELGLTTRKIFLAGHSQGGYLVAMLNTMHATNGVIANGPGPLNLVYRCQQEEQGLIGASIACTGLKARYGLTSLNPNPYYQRSLLNFTEGYKADILFVQGLEDSPIQMYSWPTFKQNVDACTNCRERIFLELPNLGHTAIFESSTAKSAFNNFIQLR